MLNKISTWTAKTRAIPHRDKFENGWKSQFGAETQPPFIAGPLGVMPSLI
jgi:hypothetical protein